MLSQKVRYTCAWLCFSVPIKSAASSLLCCVCLQLLLRAEGKPDLWPLAWELLTRLEKVTASSVWDIWDGGWDWGSRWTERERANSQSSDRKPGKPPSVLPRLWSLRVICQNLSSFSGSAPGTEMSVGPSLWPRLKYLNSVSSKKALGCENF